MRVHLAGEHALEFLLADLRFEPAHVGDHRACSVLVTVGLGEFQQFARIGKAAADAVESVDNGVQARAFAAQFLRARRVVPDVGVFQLAVYFFEAFTLGRVVKDTPGATRRGP
jgi:hypothetical protein